ncbi:MAG TPA: tetratricopeptide repeat protein [Oculatellaceae cyanobacterium]
MLMPKAMLRSKPIKVARSLSYQYFIQEGDRAYRQHQDWAEGDNLLDEALNAYSRAQEQAPDEPEVLVRIAKTFYLQGKYEKAERYAGKALELSGTKCGLGDAYLLLGEIARRKGQLNQSVEYLARAIQVGGLQSAGARYEFWRVMREALQERFSVLPLFSGGYALLTAVLLTPFQKDSAVSLGKLWLLAQLPMAWLQSEAGIGEEGGLQRCLDLYRYFPGSALLGNLIGRLYQEKGQFDEAKYWFESVIRRHPSKPEAYALLARLLEHQEAYLEMMEVYQKLLELQPGNPHVWCNLANSAYFAQSYRESLKAYETALRLGKDRRWKAMVAQSIANIYADIFQNHDAALAYYRLSQELDPSDVENYIQQGLLYFQKEDYDNAERTYQMALSIAPDNPRLYCNIGYLRWSTGDIDSAILFYEKAIALDSQYEIPLNNLGVIYLDTLGDIQKAIELFSQAITLNDHYALAHYNLGRAYSFLGKRLEAAQCFRVAQDINQFSQELDNDELTARINNLFDSNSL